MPGDQPFFPTFNSATTGGSVSISSSLAAASANSTITSTTSALAANLLVTNTSNVTIFARMSREAVPLATSLDVPILAGASRLFENPNATGVTGIAITATITGGTATGPVLFTPGNGGVF